MPTAVSLAPDYEKGDDRSSCAGVSRCADGAESCLYFTSQREDEILTAEYNGEYEDALRTLLRELLIGTSGEYAPAEEE